MKYTLVIDAQLTERNEFYVSLRQAVYYFSTVQYLALIRYE